MVDECLNYTNNHKWALGAKGKESATLLCTKTECEFDYVWVIYVLKIDVV